MSVSSPGTTDAPTQTYAFQAETRQLLDLMIHSLYSNKEIFLRELISNASDALDRLRFEALSNPELLGGEEPRIRLEADPAARTLSVADNGIGMSREEVVQNIGTIAKSGTRELVERLAQAEQETTIERLIGQFGVGFYSAFMVAERVELVTRRVGEAEATLWQSTGDGTFTVAPGERAGHGTTITLHLKPTDEEAGLPDFTDEWVLSRIVRRYSDFVAYPVVLPVEREKTADGAPAEGGGEKVVEEKRLNSMKPIWSRDSGEVSKDDYAEYYKHVSGDWNEPLETITVRAEGRFDYRALLFIPAQAPYDLFYVGSKPGLQLYVRRVQIKESAEELLPQYLRFVKGVVDSPDLPLNVSREMLQHDRQIALIKKGLTRRVLDRLGEMAEKEKEEEKYLVFWRQFGRAIKEGLSEDYAHRDKLLPLLRFASSADPEKLTSLAGYVERMQEGQEAIWYLTAESREVAESSPHLEAFRQRGVEVLLLVDPVDELVVQTLHDFDGKRLRSAAKGEVDLGPKEEREEREKALKERDETLRPLLDRLQKVLDAHVKHVRLSSRLTTSPACLVGAEHDYSPQLERLLQKGKGGGAQQRRILEVNPDHPVVRNLIERHGAGGEAAELEDPAQLLLGYACLAEGSELPDPARFNRSLAALMETSLGGPPPPQPPPAAEEPPAEPDAADEAGG